MRFRTFLACACLLLLGPLTACGGGTPRAATADLADVQQPTPDPTLDAVVRNLPRVLAGAAATPTAPSPPPPARPIATPAPKKPTPAASVRATPSPVRARR